MKNSLRLLVLSGSLALLASSAFADGPIAPPGPGGGVPPTGGANTTATSTSTSGTTTIMTEILSVLGAVGF
ncbi:MAG TPA: hypothetical protein VME18_02970 [Acidobacteriaceae bacterium]|nr:hypothetical protein [Acidobacteriaceae bacterium]